MAETIRSILQAEADRISKRLAPALLAAIERETKTKANKTRRNGKQQQARTRAKVRGYPVVPRAATLAELHQYIRKHGPLPYKVARQIPRAALKDLLTMRAVVWKGTARGAKLHIRA